MRRSSFTLIEVLIAVTVFGLVIVASSSTFVLVFNAWQRQKTSLDLLKDLSWTTEFITNEVKLAAASGAHRLRTFHNGERLAFWIDTDGDNLYDTRIWYWRGNGAGYGERDILYRGEGDLLSSANLVRQEMTENLADNPSGNNIFSVSSGLLTIEITLAKGSKRYTLRTKIRARNR